MRGNLIFFGVMLVFLAALVVVSSRSFLSSDMQAPAPGSQTIPSSTP